MGGCTVLGMAADHAIDDLITDDDPDRKKDSTLMNEGLKKDIEIIAKIVEPVVEAVKSKQSEQQESLISKNQYQCPHEVDSEDKCYSEEYYDKLYDKVRSMDEPTKVKK
jgi:hypothetical protein